MDVDSQSWQDRCDRYFTSISENGHSKPNIHDKHTDKHSSMGEVQPNKKQEKGPETWKDLRVVRKDKKRHPVFRYIRNTVFKLDFHGTKYAGTSSNMIEFIIWIIVILSLFGFTIFLVVLQYQDYREYNTHFETRTISSGGIMTSYPVISICNMNIFKRQALANSRFEYLINDSVSINLNSRQSQYTVQSILESNIKLVELIESLKNRLSENMTSLLEKDIVIREILKASNDSLISRLQNTGNTMWFHDIVPFNTSDVREYGHLLDDVIISCFTGSRECTESYFSVKSDEHLGNCITLSPEDISQRVQLVLNAEADDYITGASPSVGFRLILHQNDGDVRDGDVIHVGVNSFTSVNVKEMKIIKRQDGSCVKQPASKESCLRDCYKARIRDYCECSRDYNTTESVCGPDGVHLLVCRKVIRILHDNGLLGCSCQDNCRDTVYKTDHSTTVWPSAAEIPFISSMLLERKNMSFIEAQIRNNILKVELNLRPALTISMEERKEYEILDILAHFGGLFAFVAGMSVLTMVELIWMLAKTVFDTIVHIKTRSNRADEKEKLSDSDITSVTWAMYKQKRRHEELSKQQKQQQQANNERTDKKRHTGTGLGGNVNSRLHRRNSYLAPISENGQPSDGNIETQYKAHKKAATDRHTPELIDNHQLYELKSNKYRVMSPNNVKRYSDTNGHTQQTYSDYNGSQHNGVSVIPPPFSSSTSYTGNRNSASLQNAGRWRYDKGEDRVQMYGHTSAYFHTNISEPTFL